MKTASRILCATGLVVAVAAAMLPQPGLAATNTIQRLGLEQAFDIAERLHPDLAEARARIEAAAGRAQQAGAFPNPEAIARIEEGRFTGRTVGEAQYIAGIAQPVPLGRRLSKAREAEQLERDRRGSELEVRRRELRRRVHSAFATALYQERAFETQMEIVQSVEKAASTARARVEAGDALPEDMARAEIELARANVELKRTESLRGQALLGLSAAIGDPSLTVRSLAGGFDATFDIPTLESVAAALSTNPALAAANSEVRAQDVRVDLARAQRVPDVKVEVLYRRLEDSKANTFDIGLSIPLPLFDRNQGRVREARAELHAAEARSRLTRHELSLRLQKSYAQLTAALASSRVLRSEILPRADTVLKSAEARYAAGDTSLSDVLPVRRDWATLQLTYLESVRDVMQAWSEVRSLAGTN